MTIESHHYRPDIDGLRAIAIVAVVLYHAGITGFSGGFVGVDIFFVISGYLITSIIERELIGNRFSLAKFYERRVRRIIPALYVMMGACAVVAPLFLYPTEYQSFSRSLITATLFVSSIQFRREGGYFDVDSQSQPLLHTWSLSVEEIFYVFFPVLSLVVWRCCKSRRESVIWAVATLSLAGSVGALYFNNESRAAFFLAHFRAWEFLIGALLALSTIAIPQRRWLNQTAAVAGILMIGGAVFGYSESTTFPGAAALLPCIGAAAVIVAGQHRPSFIGRLLSARPFVFTGLISYSLYLWHWPILVFAGLWLERKPSGWEAAFLIAVSFVLAALSWRYVERPFRGKSGWLSRRTLFAASAGLGALIVAVGLHGEITDGWLSRYPAALRVILKSTNDRDPRQKECLHTRPEANGCIYGQSSEAPSVVLWGDSFAAVYSVMLGKLAEARNESVLAFTRPACPPIVGWQIEYQKWRDACATTQEVAIKAILDTKTVHTVIIGANFTAYTMIEDQHPGFSSAFSKTIRRLLDAGKRVVLLYPFPTYDNQMTKVLAKLAADNQDPSRLTLPIQSFLEETRRAFALLDGIGTDQRVLRVYPHQRLCSDEGCFLYEDQKALYYDNEHISLAAAEILAPLFESSFEMARNQSSR